MNWQAVISELEGYGLKQSEIAAAAGCARSTICEIASGAIKNPGWTIASALQKLRRNAARKASRAVGKAA